MKRCSKLDAIALEAVGARPIQSGWTGIPFFPQVFFASLKELKAPREVFLDRLRFA